jgi:hypothetical protein
VYAELCHHGILALVTPEIIRFMTSLLLMLSVVDSVSIQYADYMNTPKRDGSQRRDVGLYMVRSEVFHRRRSW